MDLHQARQLTAKRRGGSLALALAAGLFLASSIGCSKAGGIKVTGSDTMVNVAQAWQEKYHKKKPDVSIQVKGGGSGVGINSLISGKVDIATSSRQMKPEEREQAKKSSGKEPKEFIVGLDALAIYVHPDNPLDTISLAELAGIFGQSGDIERWEQLGVDNTACKDGKIIVVTRQSSSGTYAYFKEAVLGEKEEYKQGALQQSGSSDLVNLISSTPCAIGYSGMGYKTDKVKFLKVAKEKGGEGVAPSVETAIDGSYPIARPLFLYTLGEPTGDVKDFIDWIRAEEGQQVLQDLGYVPQR